MRLLEITFLICVVGLSVGCAQRMSIASDYGVAYQKIFYQQGIAPPVQLAPTTSEDAKRISESRARRSGGKNASGRSQRFSFGGGAPSNSILE